MSRDTTPGEDRVRPSITIIVHDYHITHKPHPLLGLEPAHTATPIQRGQQPAAYHSERPPGITCHGHRENAHSTCDLTHHQSHHHRRS